VIKNSIQEFIKLVYKSLLNDFPASYYCRLALAAGTDKLKKKMALAKYNLHFFG